tara:strand:+ start:234 stop:1181 length:948 start_codon:yes stop_codon:yes gene_type:complete
MYEEYFGLNSKPFKITPDPRYLFMSDRHKEGLAHLLYGVTDSGGFIQLTGEVGTGKTTLIRALLEQLPSKVEIALIMHTQISAKEFLVEICNELNIEREGDSILDIVNTLNIYLLKQHANGKKVILLVDEAQNLTPNVLEQLRLLTNLETEKDKLLQIILIGQPELRKVLAKNNLRQLAQRVTARYHLHPLSKPETFLYIEHRLRISGSQSEIFKKNAKREIYSYSSGIPRLINVICDRALLGGYGMGKRKIDKALVKQAKKEIQGETILPKKNSWPIICSVITVIVCILIFHKIGYLQTESIWNALGNFFSSNL